jgi:hypothetical protein
VLGADEVGERTVVPWVRAGGPVPPWTLTADAPLELVDAVAMGRRALAPGSGTARGRVVIVASSATFRRSALDGLAADLRRDAIGLTVRPVGPSSGPALQLVWDVRRRERGDLGTGVTWEASTLDARERAAREDRLVLLVQLSGNFDRLPET